MAKIFDENQRTYFDSYKYEREIFEKPLYLTAEGDNYGFSDKQTLIHTDINPIKYMFYSEESSIRNKRDIDNKDLVDLMSMWSHASDTIQPDNQSMILENLTVGRTLRDSIDIQSQTNMTENFPKKLTHDQNYETDIIQLNAFGSHACEEEMFLEAILKTDNHPNNDTFPKLNKIYAEDHIDTTKTNFATSDQFITENNFLDIDNQVPVITTHQNESEFLDDQNHCDNDLYDDLLAIEFG
ncbi:hypothetical protein EDEG_00992 [Edhazardia aedis USNM 41457]|uniref:Uncharacterized protein n=1 Tax=Edhazardia aedis (strain USNM 41457) TaxID=1003232 RepID=J9DU47_EDHAE|nr:hypothetical protein EDEG_00992 [Edhazardia aedis USNM 41457]|eukprot:EJW04822.1 hypothetical protein EDEG_00992 [Edhazardia aedis USNM 41457]